MAGAGEGVKHNTGLEGVDGQQDRQRQRGHDQIVEQLWIELPDALPAGAEDFSETASSPATQGAHHEVIAGQAPQ